MAHDAILTMKEAERLGEKFDKEEHSDVFRPKHYTDWTIDPYTFVMVNNMPFAEGNVVKYVCRWTKKNGLKDLRKAKRVIEMLIELNENRSKYIPEKPCL